MTQVSANFNFSVIQNVFIYRRNNFSLFPFRFPFLFLFFSKYKVRVTKYIFFFLLDSRKNIPSDYIFFSRHENETEKCDQEQQICSRTVSKNATYRVKL